MKIHYKTIINRDPKYIELFGAEGYFVVQTTTTKKTRYSHKIEFCCDEIEKAVTGEILHVQEVGNKMEGCMNIGLYLKEQDSYDSATDVWYYHPLKFCPFCSEEITLVEDYKAVEGKRNVHIPAKTTPARNEVRSYEIKVEE